jgi:hypothetical protein
MAAGFFACFIVRYSSLAGPLLRRLSLALRSLTQPCTSNRFAKTVIRSNSLFFSAFPNRENGFAVFPETRQ